LSFIAVTQVVWTGLCTCHHGYKGGDHLPCRSEKPKNHDPTPLDLPIYRDPRDSDAVNNWFDDQQGEDFNFTWEDDNWTAIGFGDSLNGSVPWSDGAFFEGDGSWTDNWTSTDNGAGRYDAFDLFNATQNFTAPDVNLTAENGALISTGDLWEDFVPGDQPEALPPLDGGDLDLVGGDGASAVDGASDVGSDAELDGGGASDGAGDSDDGSDAGIKGSP